MRGSRLWRSCAAKPLGRNYDCIFSRLPLTSELDALRGEYEPNSASLRLRSWVEAMVRCQRKEKTDHRVMVCKAVACGDPARQSRLDGTMIVYSHACRLRASSTRSARRIRTQFRFAPLAELGRSRGSLPKERKTDHRVMVCFSLAAELGFEPRHTESESAVLPLHNSAMQLERSIFYHK